MYLIEINLNKKKKYKKNKFSFQKNELLINFKDRNNILLKYNDNFFCLIDGIINDNLDEKIKIETIFKIL